MTSAEIVSWPMVLAVLVLIPGLYLYWRDMRTRQPDNIDLVRRIVHLESQVQALQNVTMQQETEIKELKKDNDNLRKENEFLRDQLVAKLKAEL